SAARLPAGTGQSAPRRSRLSWPPAGGARVRMAGPAHLGRDGGHPVQPAGTTGTACMNWTTLVDAASLSAALGDPGLRLVDARFVMLNAAPDAGRQAYLESHLPGAVYADLNLDLSDLSKVGEGRHPMPDSDAFARRLGEWGIGP